MTDPAFDLPGFAQAFQQFMADVHAAVPPPRSGLRDLVAAHLGAEASAFPSITERLHVSQHANLQLALDAIAAEDGGWELVGLPGELLHHHEFSLASLLAGRFYGPGDPCPPELVNVPVDVDRTLPCLRLGLYLAHDGGAPLVVLVSLGDEGGPRGGLRVEVVTAEAATAQRFLARLRASMHEHDIYRGKVLSFAFSEWGGFGVTFHELPSIRREDLVLPESDLDAIERHTLGVSRHAGALRAAGRHLKRGLLLYGPPGTGKTLSVMYLCGQMPGRTTILLSGPGAGALGQAAAIARALQPSMVVLEDVDLVAMERTRPGMGTNPLLFQLLNEMDGLAEDADVVFVLTTNRVDLLEPALAARPGRIDQAVEIKLPDAACRRRLLELYAPGVDDGSAAVDEVVDRMAGASAAFVKELARRAALVAADRGGDAGQLSVDDLGTALDDLLERSAPVLRSALGANPDVAPPEPAEPGGWTMYFPNAGRSFGP